MRVQLSILFVMSLAVTLSACGTEEDWANGEIESTQDWDLSVGEDTSELTVAARTRYECTCDLSDHTCRGKFRFPVVKKSTCRYKRRTGNCVGACVGRCANQNGAIKRGSEFDGVCVKREIRPNGLIKETATDCAGNDIECSEFEKESAEEDTSKLSKIAR